MTDFHKIDHTPVPIKMEMTAKEVRDLQLVLINHPSIMSNYAADLIRKIGFEYERSFEAHACYEQWRKTDGE